MVVLVLVSLLVAVLWWCGVGGSGVGIVGAAHLKVEGDRGSCPLLCLLGWHQLHFSADLGLLHATHSLDPDTHTKKNNVSLQAHCGLV